MMDIVWAGLVGTSLMSLVMALIHLTGWANADMIRAIGSLATKRYDNALLAGLFIHLAVGVCFAFGYAGISTALLQGKTDGIGMVCTLIGLLHGILMGIVLLAVGSKQHPIERFRNAGFEVAVAHIVGHVAYGMGVGLVFSLLGVDASPFS